jgi:asparagine synthase (glutamine-hydrolysing)
MSGIAGVFHCGGNFVSQHELSQMGETCAWRGLDGISYLAKKHVGLVHQMLHTTPESLLEKQPLSDPLGQLHLVMDGRVDNREELRKDLINKGFSPRLDTDAELVLQAYQCWGETCPEKIIGDFALVIWDERKRQLFCARDIFGTRPLYYWSNGETFLFGSELQQIFANKIVPQEMNEGMIGEFLLDAVTSKEETLYRNIYRLPPAYSLIVTADRIQKIKYWNPPDGKEIHYHCDEEYAEHFLEIFTQVMRSSMRSHRPVGAYLSGGLDSSSVVGLAQSLIQQGQLPDNNFETFSLVFPGFDCDESEYIQAVLDQWKVKNTAINANEIGFHEAQFKSRIDYFVSPPNGRVLDPVKKLAGEKGIRVLLTGVGGDEWLAGSSFHLADLLRQGKFLQLLHEIRAGGDSYSLQDVRKYGFNPLLRSVIPMSARRLIRWMRGGDTEASLIEPKFAKRIQLNERIRDRKNSHNLKSFARQDIWDSATGGWQALRFELENHDDAEFGIETRNPMNDRRVVEFALALPENQRSRHGELKFILREAMRELIPEKVRARQTKAGFSHLFPQAYQVLDGERIFNSLAVVEMGWINAAQASKIYRDMAQLYAMDNDKYIRYTWTLWMIFGVELWFRKTFLKEGILELHKALPPTASYSLANLNY